MPFQVRLTLRRGIPAPPDLAPPDIYDVITAITPYFSIDRVSGVFPHARLTLRHTRIDSKRRVIALLLPIFSTYTAQPDVAGAAIAQHCVELQSTVYPGCVL